MGIWLMMSLWSPFMTLQFNSLAHIIICLICMVESIPQIPNGQPTRLFNSSVSSQLSQNTRKQPIFTQYWAVEITGGVDTAKNVALRYGFKYMDEILPGIYYFKQARLSRRSVHHSIYFHDQLAHDPRVVWLEQQVAKVRVRRDVQIPINDPQWPEMWYLNRGSKGGLDMNVRSAWTRGYAGQGVVVTILDDGLEIDHPDLKDNYDQFASYDVNGDDDNPEPRYPWVDKGMMPNRHGTRCAGEVAAVANNSICGLGIAYLARIGGVRMLDGDVSDAMESRSLGYQLQHIDVYSASWGPEDDGKTVDGPGRLAQLAFRNGIQMGRAGRGSIFVWASGNGGKSGDNCNCDGYTNSIYTLGVSSVSENGAVPWYAEMCSSTLTVTYSSGGLGERGVITTDLNHTCTSNHSGTSASAPLAAGICALTLSANPQLTWRDLQYLVVYTSRPEGLLASDWVLNGAGRLVSHAFGYGLMDAGAMVSLALNWTTVPLQRVCEAQAPITGGGVSVHPNDREILALTTDGCASAAAYAGDLSQRVVYLEHVQAKVTVSSAQRGEIELRLTSPSGTVSKLLSRRPKDIHVDGFHAWPFMSVHFWGELANGTWKLSVHSGNAAVSIHDWILILYGTNTPPLNYAPHRRDIRQLPVKEVPSRASASHLTPNRLTPSGNQPAPQLSPNVHAQVSHPAPFDLHNAGSNDYRKKNGQWHNNPNLYPPYYPAPYGLWSSKWNSESQSGPSAPSMEGDSLKSPFSGSVTDMDLSDLVDPKDSDASSDSWLSNHPWGDLKLSGMDHTTGDDAPARPHAQQPSADYARPYPHAAHLPDDQRSIQPSRPSNSPLLQLTAAASAVLRSRLSVLLTASGSTLLSRLFNSL